MTHTGNGGDKPEATKPGSRICWCGYTVNISDFNHIKSSEIWVWKAHMYDVHTRKGESTNYTDKYSDGTETTGSGISHIHEYEDRDPIAVRVCQCGYAMKLYYRGDDDEHSDEVSFERNIYGKHMNQHTAKWEDSSYNDVAWAKYLKLKRLDSWYAEDPVDPWKL